MMYGNQHKAEYSAGKHPRPIAYTQAERDKQYYLKVAKHFYGHHLVGTSNLGFGVSGSSGASRRSFKTLRDHARGLQDPVKYKDRLDPLRDNGKGKKIRRWNISWQPIPFISKFRSIVIDKFDSLMLKPHTQAVDELARREREIQKNKAKLIRQQETRMFTQGTQLSVQEPPELAEAESPDDVDFIYNMGGIRLAVEIVMKDAIDLTLYQSRWATTRRMIIEDVIDLNAFAVDQVEENGRLKIKYVDPAKVIIRPSIYPDHRDSDFRGYVSQKKIATIRQEAMNDIRAGLITEADFKQLHKLAKSSNAAYNHSSGLNGWGDGRREDYVGNSQNNLYEEFGMEVMTLYFLERDMERYVVGKHRRGSEIFEPVDANFTLSDRGKKEGKTIEEYEIDRLHTFKWVVGTDIIYNYGPIDMTLWNEETGSKEICWPMVVYYGTEPSLVERSIAIDDDVQIANFKLRSLISKLPPGPRMILFKGMLADSVTIGEQTFTILDMVNEFQSEGIMVLDDAQEYSLMQEDVGTKRSPIEFLPTGIAEDYQLLESRIASGVDKYRQTWGVSEISDGTTSNPEMLKGVMQGLQNATNSALKPHMTLYVEGYTDIVKYAGYYYVEKVIDGDIKLGHLPISPEIFRAVTATENLRNHEWNIIVEVDTTENKELLIQDLMQRKEMIPPDAYFTIWNVIQAGDYKKAQYLLVKYGAKAAEAQHQRQMQLAQATAMANGEATKAAEQAKANTVTVEANAKIQVATAQLELDKQRLKEEHALELQRLEREYELSTKKELKVVEANNRNRLEQ